MGFIKCRNGSQNSEKYSPTISPFNYKILLFCFGPYPVVFRANSYQYAQRSLQAMQEKPFGQESNLVRFMQTNNLGPVTSYLTSSRKIFMSENLI